MAIVHFTVGKTTISKAGLRRLSFPALLMLLCISASMTFAADAMSQIADFDIGPQAMESALHEWSRQSNVQVMVASDDVSGQRTAGVKGRFTAASALTQLLRQTNLMYETVGGNTVTVKRLAATMPAGSDEASSERAPAAVEGIHSEVATPSAASANAAEPGSERQSRRALEEVIVTAQRREEQLQDVPISIAVVDGDDLDRSSSTAVTEVLNNIPGVATIVVPGGSTQVAVRGVTATNANFSGSSPIAYYVDSVPFGFVRTAIAPDLAPYDLDRIEVLRGPQGTLYGASALNGVVRVLTKGADLDEFSFKARTSVSTTEEGGGNYGGDAAINVPLIEGRLAARGVLGYQYQSGWIENSVEQNVNDAHLRNYRLKINGSLTERLSIQLSAWRQVDDYGGISASFDDFIRPMSKPETISKDLDSYGLTIGYDSALFSVTSMTSYVDYKSVTFFDQNFRDLVFRNDVRSRVFSQELTLNSAHDATWQWTVGAFYRDGADRAHQGFFVHQGSLLIDSFAPLDEFKDTSESVAFFGEIGRRFFDDQLEWTLGLRYFRDEGASQGKVLDLNRYTATSKATTPRAVLKWKPSTDFTVYTSYSQGFRSGFPQDELVTSLAPAIPPVKPDKLRNYEIGAKGTLGERVAFDAAVYYVDWDDLQQVIGVPFSNVPGCCAIASVNGESASGMGFDLGLVAKPVDGLDLHLGVSWNDLTMDEPVFSAGTLLFDKGDRLAQSPEWTGSASAEYSFPVGASGFQTRLFAGATYTSEQNNSTIFGGPNTVTTGDSMLISRIRLTIEAPDHWSVALFVDNLNDERGTPLKWITGFPEYDVRVRPRTFGCQLEYRFKASPSGI